MAKARITSVHVTAAVQASFWPVTLCMAVANFATAVAPYVAVSNDGVTLLTTLVASVGLAFILDTE